MELRDLEKNVEEILERNKRVELDKKWESSTTRKVCIAILTYIVVIIYSFLISKTSNVFLSSLVPVFCFTFSSLSLKAVRKVWEKKNV